MTPWFLQRAHFGERCVMDPIGGIGDDLISVEEGCNKNNITLAYPVKFRVNLTVLVGRVEATSRTSADIYFTTSKVLKSLFSLHV